MKVEHVILADSAQVADGKLYILGGVFGLVRCAGFPAQHPMAVAVSLRLLPEDVGGKHPVTVQLTDPDGTAMVPPGTIYVSVSAPEVPELDSRALFVVNVQVPLQKPGRYTQTVTAGDSTVSASFTAIFSGQQVELAPSDGPKLGRRMPTVPADAGPGLGRSRKR